MAETAEITKAAIVNWALSELGLAPNFSIDAETKLGGVVAIFWPRCEARCFGLHDWTFCRRTLPLIRQVATPQTGYRYGFDLPADRIGEPLKLLAEPRSEAPLRDFRIEGNTLFCDEAQAWATCKVALSPEAWDPQFRDAFAVALAGYLAVPLLQDLELQDVKLAMAFGTRSEGGTGGLFGRLIAQNRAAHPLASPIQATDPLTAGRVPGQPWYGRF